MKLITKSSDLISEFNYLLDFYPQYFFATAWAGMPAELSNKLLENANRIKQFVVGIHFYQTDPSFFFKFLNVKAIRAVLQPNGTFHPKIYLFYKNETQWTLLIGSANFTNAAFSVNTETTILIESHESDYPTLKETLRVINDNWEKGKIVDNEFYLAYKLLWTQMKSRRQELEGSTANLLRAGTTEFMNLSWKAYVAKFNHVKGDVYRRFEMLESIRGIFSTGRSLIDMNEDERRFIGGNPNKLTIPGADRFGEFGTSGNGQFMKKMIDGNILISQALDKIPLVGIVTEEDYNAFLDNFLREIDITIGWVSSAARLLALKRPDVFYNITSANRENFCINFNNTKTQTKLLTNYWQLVVNKIQFSKWYNDAEPINDFERQLYATRSAMLDVLFYV